MFNWLVTNLESGSACGLPLGFIPFWRTKCLTHRCDISITVHKDFFEQNEPGWAVFQIPKSESLLGRLTPTRRWMTLKDFSSVFRKQLPSWIPMYFYIETFMELSNAITKLDEVMFFAEPYDLTYWCRHLNWHWLDANHSTLIFDSPIF